MIVIASYAITFVCFRYFAVKSSFFHKESGFIILTSFKTIFMKKINMLHIIFSASVMLLAKLTGHLIQIIRCMHYSKLKRWQRSGSDTIKYKSQSCSSRGVLLLAYSLIFLCKQVSIIRKYHNHTLQLNPQHN